MQILTIGNWRVRKAADPVSSDHIEEYTFDWIREDDEWMYSPDAASAHQILLDNERIDSEILKGEGEGCRWVSEADWIYRTTFDAPETQSERCFLKFCGIDTCADVFLNGAWIAHHDELYIPLEVEISDRIQAKNELLLYIHSPYKVVRLRSADMPDEWKNKVHPERMLRKPDQDFSCGLGARPYITPIGLFEDVLLCLDSGSRINNVTTDYQLGVRLDRAELSTSVRLCGSMPGYAVGISVYAPDDALAARTQLDAECEEIIWDTVIDRPRLWYPKGYGAQELYRICVELKDEEGRTVDSQEIFTGFRKVDAINRFRFRINGRDIRLWGANYVPHPGLDHRWNADLGLKTLQMLDACNMNLVRIWGQGVLPGKEFYAYCDRHGLLIWHDLFVCGYGAFPDSEKYVAYYLRESAYVIQNVKHHPSILFWCGNNETLFVANSPLSAECYYGCGYLQHEQRKLVSELDPNRPYVPSSPDAYGKAEDTDVSDTHGYQGLYYAAHQEYPLFCSEECHICMPPLHSLKKFIPEEELWHEGDSTCRFYPGGLADVRRQAEENHREYRDINTSAKNYPNWLAIPKGLKKYFGPLVEIDALPIGNYYDADDLDSFMYRYGAASCEAFRHSIGRARCGSSAVEAAAGRRSAGLMVWRMNNPWPIVDLALIDAYMEPSSAYYQVKRSFAPVTLYIDVKDHINLWGINDSSEDFFGKVRFCVFDKFWNRMETELEIPVYLRAGQSRVLECFDDLGAIRRECVLYAELLDPQERVIGWTDEFLAPECTQLFPEAKLTMRVEGSVLHIVSDSFARFVELKGNDDGDEFGWIFEDNYFDLIPFREKTVRIMGTHTKGRIEAKAHYSPYIASAELEVNKERAH